MIIETNKIYNMNCMDGMALIPDGSIDLILCDLPYGITDCHWDKKLPTECLWAEYNRIIKTNGAIILTATLKFAVELINANKKYFRYELIWEKAKVTGFANANKMPLRNHELILVFYKKLPTYNPQGLIEIKDKRIETRRATNKDSVYKEKSLSKSYVPTHKNYPKSVWKYPNDRKGIHPTQKPLQLFKNLILTYSNVGEIVLDNCMGSGTTALASLETGRKFIGFEMDEHYFEVANERIANAMQGGCSSIGS